MRLLLLPRLQLRCIKSSRRLRLLSATCRLLHPQLLHSRTGCFCSLRSFVWRLGRLLRLLLRLLRLLLRLLRLLLWQLRLLRLLQRLLRLCM